MKMEKAADDNTTEFQKWVHQCRPVALKQQNWKWRGSFH